MAAPTLEARAHSGLSYTTLLDSTSEDLPRLAGVGRHGDICGYGITGILAGYYEPDHHERRRCVALPGTENVGPICSARADYAARCTAERLIRAQRLVEHGPHPITRLPMSVTRCRPNPQLRYRCNRPLDHADGRCCGVRHNQVPVLIIPAPTVTPDPSSIRMNEPVVRFFE